jgi:hypothetical protein
MTSQPPTERWHHHYNNPSDDLVFKSSDNVKFRLSSHLMARSRYDTYYYVNIYALTMIYSSVFKDMLSTPTATDTTNSTRPIDIELKASTFERFIDLAFVTTPGILIKAMSFDCCRKLLPFTERYECRPFAALLSNRLKATGQCRERALEYFLLASERDDLKMGGAALLHIDVDSVNFFEKWPQGRKGQRQSAKVVSYLNQLRPAWRQSLNELMLESMIDGHPRIAINWKTVADQFTERCLAHEEG